MSTISAFPARRPLYTAAGVALGVALAAAIVGLPFPLGLAIGPAIAGAIGLLLWPWLGLAALVLSVPVQEAGAVSFGGSTITATKLLLAGVVALFAVQLPFRRQGVIWSPLLALYAIYMAIMAISLHSAASVGAGLVEIYRWGVALFALLLALYFIRSRQQILALVCLMGAGALAEAGLGLVQSTLNLGPASFAVSAAVSRAFGTFGKPNSYAGYLELTGPLVAAVAVWSGRETLAAIKAYRRVRVRGLAPSSLERRRLYGYVALTIWLALCALAALTGIGASFSRGAWLGTAAATGTMLLFLDRRIPIVAAFAAVVLAILLAAGGADYAPAFVRDRFTQLSSQLKFFDSRAVMVNDENFSTVERMAHWQTGIAMFIEHPILGVGAGNYNARFTDFAVNHQFSRSQGHAHNYYIHAAAETGLVGVVGYLLMLGTAATLCVRAARRAPTDLGRAVGIGALGVTVSLAVHNLVENLHVLNLGIQLSAVWALVVIVMQLRPATRLFDRSSPDAG